MIRVFPRRTSATPDDALAYVGLPDLFVQADRIEISVAFTWDLPLAESLAAEWERIAPVQIGGPATGQAGGEFWPGTYLKTGYTITSRGCPRQCYHCLVPQREGKLRELPIRDGWIVQDDNLLACRPAHIRAVFEMLARQPQQAEFRGGLDCRLFNDAHLELLMSLRFGAQFPRVYFSYNNPRDEYAPLRDAAEKLWQAGFPRSHHCVRCYVLIGFPGDAISFAQERLSEVLSLGITPFAMLYRGFGEQIWDKDWRRLQRDWCRPAIIYGVGPAT